jgi:hypothetical protein
MKTWIRALEWVQDSPLQSLILRGVPASLTPTTAHNARASSLSVGDDNVSQVVELVLGHCRRTSVTGGLKRLIISGVTPNEAVIDRIVSSGIFLEYLGTDVSNSNLVSCTL